MENARNAMWWLTKVFADMKRWTFELQRSTSKSYLMVSYNVLEDCVYKLGYTRRARRVAPWLTWLKWCEVRGQRNVDRDVLHRGCGCNMVMMSSGYASSLDGKKEGRCIWMESLTVEDGEWGYFVSESWLRVGYCYNIIERWQLLGGYWLCI